MKSLFFGLFIFVVSHANAQITKVSLQASGLTCSMCSKAVKIALEEVSFVEKVQVDIKNQQYNLSFDKDAAVDLDLLKKAVEDAGFSVASLKVSTTVSNIKAEKDLHIQIGKHFFHFLNQSKEVLNGAVTFSVVDKGFVSAKDFKQYAALTTMPCIETGRMASCCSTNNGAEATRIYHVII